MTKHEFTDVATNALGQFGNAAHQVIALYREGGERIAAAANERWDTAFAQAKPQLDAETRKNAKHFKEVVGGYWTRAIALSTDGATIAIDTVVGAAITGVERMAGYAHAKA
jgi:hypothetical protein